MFAYAKEDTNQAIADMFAKLFQTAYSYATPHHNSNSYSVPSSNDIFDPLMNEISLFKDLGSVKPVFSLDSDGIPACVL